MLYNQDLIDIINRENFKQFFQLLDYLLIAGFKEIDAFGIALKHFPENKIWENVAFVKKYEFKPVGQLINPLTGDINLDYSNTSGLIIGILNEDTIHLSGLFDLYKEKLCAIGLPPIDDTIIIDLEQHCKIQIKFKPLSYLVNNYLQKTFKKHFGYEMSPKDNKSSFPSAEQVARINLINGRNFHQ